MGDDLPAVNLGTGRFATKLSTMFDAMCALLDNSRVKCWGHNGEGRLGQEHTAALGNEAGEMGDNLPEINFGTGGYRAVLSVATRQNSSCAILDDHTLKCWGYNGTGNLGLGDLNNRGDGANEMGSNLPTVDLGSGRKVLQVAMGYYHVCAILDNRSLKCWGSGDDGRLGTDSLTWRGDDLSDMGDNLPVVNVGSDRKVMSVSAGEGSTCAILDDSTVKCWGKNVSGELGLGDTTQRGGSPGDMAALPTVDLGTDKKAIRIASGAKSNCALLQDSSLKCWGNSSYGQLGRGSASSRGDDANEMGDNLAAIDFGTNRKVIFMPDFYETPCAMLDDGTTKCWGRNDEAQLGDGSKAHKGDGGGEMGANLAALSIGTGLQPTLMAPAREVTLAITQTAVIKAWGRNNNGQLGYGVAGGSNVGDSAGEMGDNTPVIGLGTGRFPLQVSAGYYFFCALTDMALVKCWGHNVEGQLGLGDTATRGDNGNELDDYLPYVSLW